MNVGRVRSGFWLEGVSTSLYSTFSSLAKTVCLVDDTQWMGSWQCSIYTCHVTSSGSLLKHLDRCHPSSHRLCSFQLCQVKVAAAHSRNLHLFDVSKTWTESFAYVRGWKKTKNNTQYYYHSLSFWVTCMLTPRHDFFILLHFPGIPLICPWLVHILFLWCWALLW